MSDNDINKIVLDLKDHFDKAMIAVRDSTPPALSKILMDQNKKLDDLHTELSIHKEKFIDHAEKEEVRFSKFIEATNKNTDKIKSIELWQIKIESYISGVKFGGKAVYTGIAFTAATVWLVFGETIKRKFGW